jgi:opacity protein-like surface antigen
MSRRTIGATAVLTALLATSGSAQNAGFPVVNNGIVSGLTLSGDVGFPNDDAGNGTAYGATGRLGLGGLGFTASISSYKPDGGESDVSFGATANLNIFGGPLIPFALTLQGGASRFEDEGVSLWHFPLGVGFSARIPTTVFGLKPWIAPRLDVTQISGEGVETDTQTNFGLSAGIELNLLSGLGFHVAYDYVNADGGLKPSTFGVGVHYSLNVPGL